MELGVTLALNPTDERALKLLGTGNILQEQVASALGVTPAYISQLMADENFSRAVQELRFKNLQKHTERDNELDSLEDAILDKMKKSLPLVMRPMELTRMLQVVNGAKRRGVAAPETAAVQTQVVTISVPVHVVNRFVTNQENQVVQVGEQPLITMQSGVLLERAKNVTSRSSDVETASGSEPGTPPEKA